MRAKQGEQTYDAMELHKYQHEPLDCEIVCEYDRNTYLPREQCLDNVVFVLIKRYHKRHLDLGFKQSANHHQGSKFNLALI